MRTILDQKWRERGEERADPSDLSGLRFIHVEAPEETWISASRSDDRSGESRQIKVDTTKLVGLLWDASDPPQQCREIDPAIYREAICWTQPVRSKLVRLRNKILLWGILAFVVVIVLMCLLALVLVTFL